MIKTISKKKKCKKTKWLLDEALKIAEKRKLKAKEKRKDITILNAEFHRTARRNKKSFLGDQCKEIEENLEWERLKISSRRLETPREHLNQIWTQYRTEMV